jgi:hypothetical protein
VLASARDDLAPTVVMTLHAELAGRAGGSPQDRPGPGTR